MKIIHEWVEKDLECFVCGTDKSVKYEHNGEPVCNLCIIPLLG